MMSAISSYTPPARPTSHAIAIWIKEHPKLSIFALVILAAAFTAVVTTVPMSMEAEISSGFVGGAALLVAAFVVWRLFNMHRDDYLMYLLGLQEIKHGRKIQFCSHEMEYIESNDGHWLLWMSDPCYQELEAKVGKLTITRPSMSPGLYINLTDQSSAHAIPFLYHLIHNSA